MSEFEEAALLLGDVDEGIDAEAVEADELPAEEREQFVEEAKVASENVKELGGISQALKDLNIPQLLKRFTVFIVQQAAIGAIFYGVTVALNKITASGGSGSASSASDAQKLEKTKALSTLIQDLTTTSNSLVTWLTEKQDVRVSLSGIKVPLVDLFTQYTDAIQTNLDAAYAVAKLLIDQTVTPPTFNVPTTGQVTTIVTSSDGFVTALKGFVDFAAGKASEFPDLSTLPVTQATVTNLTTDLDKVKQLPY